LPADLGFGLLWIQTPLNSKDVQSAPFTTGETATVEKDAGAVDCSGLPITVGIAHGDPIGAGLGPVLPHLWGQLCCPVLDPFAVGPVGEVGTKGAATGVRRISVDALTSLAEYAVPT